MRLLEIDITLIKARYLSWITNLIFRFSGFLPCHGFRVISWTDREANVKQQPIQFDRRLLLGLPGVSRGVDLLLSAFSAQHLIWFWRDSTHYKIWRFCAGPRKTRARPGQIVGGGWTIDPKAIWTEIRLKKGTVRKEADKLVQPIDEISYQHEPFPWQ